MITEFCWAWFPIVITILWINYHDYSSFTDVELRHREVMFINKGAEIWTQAVWTEGPDAWSLRFAVSVLWPSASSLSPFCHIHLFSIPNKTNRHAQLLLEREGGAELSAGRVGGLSTQHRIGTHSGSMNNLLFEWSRKQVHFWSFPVHNSFFFFNIFLFLLKNNDRMGKGLFN